MRNVIFGEKILLWAWSVENDPVQIVSGSCVDGWILWQTVSTSGDTPRSYSGYDGLIRERAVHGAAAVTLYCTNKRVNFLKLHGLSNKSVTFGSELLRMVSRRLVKLYIQLLHTKSLFKRMLLSKQKAKLTEMGMTEAERRGAEREEKERSRDERISD